MGYDFNDDSADNYPDLFGTNKKTNPSKIIKVITKFSDKLKIIKTTVKNLPRKNVVMCAIIIILVFAGSVLVLKRPAKPKDVQPIPVPNASEANKLTYEESVSKGIIENANSILEVHLTYNSSFETHLSIKSAEKKNGYPPQITNEPAEYVIKLLSGTDVLLEQGISIPNKIMSPPPLDGDTSNESITLSLIEFSVTIPWDENTSGVYIYDMDGNLLSSIERSDIVEIDNSPVFSTIKGNDVIESGEKENPITESIKNLTSRVLGIQTPTSYVDVAIIGDSYSQAELDVFHHDVNVMIDHLLSYEPFATRYSQFLFHFVDNTEDLGCYYYGRAIICNISKIINILNTAGVPHDKVLVLVNNNTYGGAAIDYTIGTSYNSTYGKEVFVHEFGHIMGRLNDEYIANNNFQDLDKNCFRGTFPNTDWESIVLENDYYRGCNFPDMYRSSQNSIMRSLSYHFFNAISQYWLNYFIDQYAGKFVTDTPTTTPTPTPTEEITLLTPTPSPEPTIANSQNPTSAPTSSPTDPTATPGPNPTFVPTHTPTPTTTLTPTTAPTSTPIPTPTTSVCSIPPSIEFIDTDTYNLTAGGSGVGVALRARNPNPSNCPGWDPPKYFSASADTVTVEGFFEIPYTLSGQHTGEWPSIVRAPGGTQPGTYHVEYRLDDSNHITATINVY